MRLFIFLFLSLFLAMQLNFSHARVEYRQFEKAELEERYNVMIDELRCLVCQNQNLKDSNSDLAKDMRDKVFEMISDGKTNKEISDFMVARYGDFVLYKPPFKASTLMLWLGPLLFLIIALVVVIKIIKQRSLVSDGDIGLSEEEHQRAQKLLASTLSDKDKTQ